MARTFSSAGRLSIGDVTPIDITGTALSIHCFASWPSGSTERTLVAKWHTVVGTRQYLLSSDTQAAPHIFGAVRDGAGQDVANGATALQEDSRWYACGLRKNGTGAGALAVFLNGVSDGTATSNRSIQNTTTPLAIGAQWDGATAVNSHNGRIAEVGIWDVALTDVEFLALASGVSPILVRPANLKGYWPIWAVASPDVDLSPNSINATLSGTAALADHAPVGAPWRPQG